MDGDPTETTTTIGPGGSLFMKGPTQPPSVPAIPPGPQLDAILAAQRARQQSLDAERMMRSLPRTEKAVQAAMQFQAQRGYQQDVASGVDPAKAMMKWGPGMFGMAGASAAYRAAETKPNYEFHPALGEAPAYFAVAGQRPVVVPQRLKVFHAGNALYEEDPQHPGELIQKTPSQPRDLTPAQVKTQRLISIREKRRSIMANPDEDSKAQLQDLDNQENQILGISEPLPLPKNRSALVKDKTYQIGKRAWTWDGKQFVRAKPAFAAAQDDQPSVPGDSKPEPDDSTPEPDEPQ